jgi:hypothetical protein
MICADKIIRIISDPRYPRAIWIENKKSGGRPDLELNLMFGKIYYANLTLIALIPFFPS